MGGIGVSDRNSLPSGLAGRLMKNEAVEVLERGEVEEMTGFLVFVETGEGERVEVFESRQ